MQSESTPDRSFLLCELAAILAVMASAPLAAAEPPASTSTPDEARIAGSDTREPITYDHVYGAQKIAMDGSPAPAITWLDGDHYIVRDPKGMQKVHAGTAVSSDWYDKGTLAGALHLLEGITEEMARDMADGRWIKLLSEKRIVVFRQHERLIRITLDGKDASIVDGVPADLELASISPTGNALAYIFRNDLWVADFTSGQIRKLTHSTGPEIRNGKADWVYFEEVYNRKWQAYRWSPDGTRLAYQQFNDAKVPTFRISDHATVRQTFETEHYPVAGDPNPVVRLGVVSMQGGETEWIDTSAYDEDDLLITHFNWLSDNKSVCFYVQNRIQTWLDVLKANADDGSSRTLFRDQTPAWVDSPPAVTFLTDGSFLFFSERSGYRHLYRVSADGKRIKSVTSGEWEVRDLHAVSGDESFAIIAAAKESPISVDLYRVPLSESGGEPVRLTPENGSHAAIVSPGCSYIVDTWSSLSDPARTVLRDSSGAVVRTLSEPIEVPSDKFRFGQLELRDVPMSDGSTTQAIFVFPPDFDRSKIYPVWLKTYGGPHTPSVKDLWNPRLQEHLLANLGVVVVIFDPRSSSGYGAKSAWLAYRNLGVEETKDLESLCDWLEVQDWVDQGRIGMSGHSYGGYFVSYAMTHTNKLCAGIAGAPVTDWAHYDTIYTERFMSTPRDNPDGYKRSSVIESAANLYGRLLLLHGLKDDNVHPENSIQLAHSLQNANKQFELMLYPTHRHPINGTHYEKLVFNFIMETMGKPEAKQP